MTYILVALTARSSILRRVRGSHGGSVVGVVAVVGCAGAGAVRCISKGRGRQSRNPWPSRPRIPAGSLFERLAWKVR
jgi:hypothetical protein